MSKIVWIICTSFGDVKSCNTGTTVQAVWEDSRVVHTFSWYGRSHFLIRSNRLHKKQCNHKNQRNCKYCSSQKAGWQHLGNGWLSVYQEKKKEVSEEHYNGFVTKNSTFLMAKASVVFLWKEKTIKDPEHGQNSSVLSQQSHKTQLR